MKSQMKMEQAQEQSLSILIDEDEHLTGNNCPRCGYPTVIEYGLEVCYHCGWSKEE